MTRNPLPIALLAVLPLSAQAIDRVQGADSGLSCADIAQQQADLKATISAGSTERTMGQAAVGGAANVGGQVAAAQAAGSIFGAFGGLVAKAAGAVAQTTAETKMGASEEQQALAKKAQSRSDFLAQLASAKQCGGQEKALTLEEYQQVAMAPAVGTIQVVPMSQQSIQKVLAENIEPIAADGLLSGQIKLTGKKVYVQEYRVMFDVSGEVKANTRGGYLLGTDYGSTRVTVTYKIPNVDVAAFQAITDRAWEDFKQRLGRKGLDVVYGQPADGAVYEATEEPSTPAKPVYTTVNLGHSKRTYLMMAPTGMKLVPRGFAGIGAGNIGKRIEWSKTNQEGLMITQTINLTEHESSGSGSSIWKRQSTADVKSALIVGNSPMEWPARTAVNSESLRTEKPMAIDGQFANFRDVGGYDSTKDAGGRALGLFQNMMGQGANQYKTINKEVDLDGPAMARLSLQGMVTYNQAIVDGIK